MEKKSLGTRLGFRWMGKAFPTEVAITAVQYTSQSPFNPSSSMAIHTTLNYHFLLSFVHNCIKVLLFIYGQLSMGLCMATGPNTSRSLFSTLHPCPFILLKILTCSFVLDCIKCFLTVYAGPKLGRPSELSVSASPAAESWLYATK